MASKSRTINGKLDIPPAHDWRTTDVDEINRRRLRARNERFAISNLDACEPVHSRFRVKSATGMTYSVEIRDVAAVKDTNLKLGARIAILAVPASAAQKVTELLIDAGIRAILNFAPVLLRVPKTVYVRNVSFLQEIAVLSYHLSSDLLSDLNGYVPALDGDKTTTNGSSHPRRTQKPSDIAYPSAKPR